ncbi:MAG TPA: sigma-70 family RNA polymerase sigma factor [Candidatus Angelobacter sp.]|nr:sigma-70 family RNA polymerase sigma factor [Candidatus Angelobacter sp.]
MQIAQANLAAIAGEGFRPGLEQIFLEHKELVFRAAYRVTGNATDAEDVLQTVFLRLARLDKFPEITNLPGYLHRSAVNASLDLLRGRKDSQTLSLDEDPNQAEAVSTDHGPRSAELRDWLRHALARLNPRWAEMFVLRFIEDKSNREIAAIMKTSPAVVAVVLHRTRSLLKKDYQQTRQSR